MQEQDAGGFLRPAERAGKDAIRSPAAAHVLLGHAGHVPAPDRGEGAGGIAVAARGECVAMAQEIQTKRHGVEVPTPCRGVSSEDEASSRRSSAAQSHMLPAAGGAVFESTSNVIMKPFVPLNS